MGWHVLRRCFGLVSNACLDFPPLIYGDLYLGTDGIRRLSSANNWQVVL